MSQTEGVPPPSSTTASLLREALGSRSWKLIRCRATTIFADLSWPVFLLLFVWTIASLQPGEAGPAFAVWQRWAAGGLAAALYFLSVLLQELAYLRLAAGLGEAPQRLVLYPFGRASQAGDRPFNLRQELAVSLVGPVSAAVLAALFLLVARLVTPGSPFAGAVFRDVGGATAILAGFRLLPGLPLDGGRLLRLAWWQGRKDFGAAGRAASWAGETLAFVLVGLGAYLLLRRDWVTGLWVTTAGWLLRNAAVSSQRQIVVRSVMADISAARIMDRDFVSVRPDLTVRRLVDGFMAVHHQHGYPVVANGRLLGLVTTVDLARAAPDLWGETEVRAIMTPAADLQTLSPEADGNQILQQLAERDFHQLPVLEGGRLIGMVSRNNVVQYLKWQTDVGMYG